MYFSNRIYIIELNVNVNQPKDQTLCFKLEYKISKKKLCTVLNFKINQYKTIFLTFQFCLPNKSIYFITVLFYFKFSMIHGNYKDVINII